MHEKKGAPRLVIVRVDYRSCPPIGLLRATPAAGIHYSVIGMLLAVSGSLPAFDNEA